jgi:AraC-like DNA-binding protein
MIEQAGSSMEQVLALSELEHNPRMGISERVKQESDAVIMLQSAIELTKNPALPLHLGRRFDVTALGSYGFAIMSCTDLGSCMRIMKRYQTTLGAGPSWRVLDHEAGLAIRTSIALGSPDQRRVVSELVFSQLCSTAEFLINDHLRGAELQLCYTAPDYAAEYEQLLSIPVTFDQPHNQLLLPKTLLSCPVRTANRDGHEVFLQQCEEMLQDRNKIENTSAAVRRLLLQSAGDFPCVRQTAQRLNVSERTLRRRLEAEASTFRAIKEEVKNILALKYLANTQLTIAEVASLLDYTEAVNFRQAFMRWHGITPTQYRQQRL